MLPVVCGVVDLGSMEEDGTFRITSEQLLAKASDVDGDELSVLNLKVAEGEGAITGNKALEPGPSRQVPTGMAPFGSPMTSAMDMLAPTLLRPSVPSLATAASTSLSMAPLGSGQRPMLKSSAAISSPSTTQKKTPGCLKPSTSLGRLTSAKTAIGLVSAMPNKRVYRNGPVANKPPTPTGSRLSPTTGRAMAMRITSSLAAATRAANGMTPTPMLRAKRHCRNRYSRWPEMTKQGMTLNPGNDAPASDEAHRSA